jgi:predicted phosphate transport protein (TIGR00153 family)
MFGRLLPKETSFFDFFEQHAALTLEGVKEFKALVDHGIENGSTELVNRAKRVLEIEHETDVITHRCIEALHKTFITPMDRDDIHRLITTMDDIMDSIEAATDRIMLYEVKRMAPEAIEFATVLVSAVEEVHRAVHGLRDMKHAEEVLKICININKLENQADTILRRALARLFKEESDAVEVIKWKEIFENLENAADVCEDVADIVEGVILEGA